MNPPPLRLGVLGSGKGTNFEAIARAIERGELNAEIRLVVSDVPDAPILEKAAALGVAWQALPGSQYRTRLEPELEAVLAALLGSAGVELVVLAGYMRIVKAPLLERFEGRIVNIHPSLLPAFPGREAWRQALEAGVAWTGCTVHWVDAGVDTGEIIAQQRVDVAPDDTAETLRERIQRAENALYPRALEELHLTLREKQANQRTKRPTGQGP
jgi:phosphoribosylglycinamide formyltransferase-1